MEPPAGHKEVSVISIVKKVLTAVSAVLLLSACAGSKPQQTASPLPSAPAAQNLETLPNSSPASAALKYDFPETGVSISLPESFLSIRDFILDPDDSGEFILGSGIVSGTLSCLLHSAEEKEEYEAWRASISPDAEVTEEMTQKMQDYMGKSFPLYMIFGINDGREYKDLVEELGLYEDRISRAVDLGELDGFRFYSVELDFENEDVRSALEECNPEAAKQYRVLLQDIQEHPEYVSLIHCSPAYNPPGKGTHISFETTDLDGNPVKSDDLFKEHDITMVSIFRTWFGVCIDEFPDIDKIAEDFEDQNIAVVTYCADARNEELTETARAEVEPYRSFYKNLAYDESVDAALPWRGTPCTYFVGKDGTVLCLPIQGAAVEDYIDHLNKLLKGERIDHRTSIPASVSEETYKVRVTDQDGSPVSHVFVSFCTDTNCNTAESGEDGIASFTGPAYPYHIQIVSVPDGYSYDEKFSAVMDGTSPLTVQITKE
jgi:thiol-disulfide isomerase/thioredoxin